MPLRRLLVIACIGSVASLARADRVHLKGGTVIEGKVTTEGDKVLVELESGQIALARSAVERIEESESALERIEAKLKQLKAGDVKGLLKLANECRNRDLPDSERKVLRKLLEVEPDHSEARARLGYVRSESGWVTQAEARRAEGMVKRDGLWLTREQALELERLEAETKAAKLMREQAETRLQTQRAELERSEAEAQLLRAQAQAGTVQSVPNGYSVVLVQSGATSAPLIPYYPYSYGPRLTQPSPGFTQPMPIPGVRDPRDMTFSIPGVQDPRRR